MFLFSRETKLNNTDRFHSKLSDVCMFARVMSGKCRLDVETLYSFSLLVIEGSSSFWLACSV